MPGWVYGILIAAAVLLAAGAALYSWRRKVRAKVYSELSQQRAAIVPAQGPKVGAQADAAALQEAFERDRLVRIPHFLEPASLERLRQEALENIPRMDRSFIPKHKKGATLSYEKIHHLAPGCLAVYHSPEVQRWISSIVGVAVGPTADHDQSSCSILCYTEGGDHINWHFDHNFYQGRHFTILISLVNRSAAGDVSASKLQRRTRQGEQFDIDTSENTLVVFEGARVLHRASPTQDGDQRLMLSMTYCTNPKIGRLKEIARRIKDTAYYGLRVLWD